MPAKNRFEGTKTVRIYNLLIYGKLYERIPVHENVLPIVERVLDPGCLVSSLSSIAICDDEKPQPLHADDQLIPIPRPHVPIVCNTMWALTDFTDANGATRIVPGSHKCAIESPDYFGKHDSIPAEMPKGSVMVYNGSLWHGGGANRTGSAPHRRGDELLRRLHPPAGEPAARHPARDRGPVRAAAAGAGRLLALQRADRPHRQVPSDGAARPRAGLHHGLGRRRRMTLDRDHYYRFYGADVSYFTAKVRPALRYKRVPYLELLASPRAYREVIVPRTGLAFIPIVITDRDETWQDTSVILDNLEARFPDPPLYPSDPVLRVLAYLFELYADEFLVLPAMHYRWSFPASIAKARADFAAVNGDPAAASKFADRMSGSIGFLGVSPSSIPGIEAHTRELLAAMSAHLAAHPVPARRPPVARRLRGDGTVLRPPLPGRGAVAAAARDARRWSATGCSAATVPSPTPPASMRRRRRCGRPCARCSS